jgi:inorganic pyrophosphatase
VSLSLHRPHPWHGIGIGEKSPHIVTCYIELVPTDTVKFEIDKPTGYLRIDRPQRFSNVCPTLYGFIPRTLCGNRVGARAGGRVGNARLKGDADPMDVCVFTDRDIAHGDIILSAVPIGGLRFIDSGAADEKIIAVLEGDSAYGNWKDISDCPAALVDRLRHYFLTYKSAPETPDPPDRYIAEVYGREEAHEVIRLSAADYDEAYGQLRQ